MPEPPPFEYCCLCQEATGRAGRHDDSLYCDDCDAGPFCEVCDDGHVCKDKKESPDAQ